MDLSSRRYSANSAASPARSVLQPDIVVAPRTGFTARDLSGAPALAVEILSPSTRRIDLVLKHDCYRSGGCAAYWVVDPDEPSVRAWRLEGDTYVDVGHAAGEGLLELDHPFPVRIRPSDLVR